MDKTHILVVDDDPAILKLLHTNLKARGYKVTVAMDGQGCLEAMESDFVDLIILDIMMPKLDGVEVCRRLREWTDVPIIVLSAKGDEKDKVKCLELGADDYLTKPFGIDELMARIKTAFRHVGSAKVAPAQSTFKSGELEINFAMRRVTVGDTEIVLTSTEFSVLQHLAVNVDKVLTHNMILENVWGGEYGSEKDYVRVFIGRLRKKLRTNGKRYDYIKTVSGVGYRLIKAT